MRVLVACEFSGVVRRAFRALGHDAYPCDLLAAEDGSPHHLQIDALTILDDGWDLLIAHPTCTRLCNSGSRWLYRRGTREIIPDKWAELEAGASLFRALWRCSIPRIAVENPIMHRHARAVIGCDAPTQIIQPWQFGHGEMKATCLWLKGLPKLIPTRIVPGRVQRVHRMKPGPDRWRERSRTYEGIGAAMAAQWGEAGGSHELSQ